MKQFDSWTRKERRGGGTGCQETTPEGVSHQDEQQQNRNHETLMDTFK